MREEGSGTRSEFENAIAKLGASPRDLSVALVLPSNEAVLSAVCSGQSAAAISSAAAGAYLQQGLLVRAAFDLPVRSFRLLRHKERHASKAALTLEAMCKG
jgi:DNA-binding transcriptional LysR family regulator